MSAPEDPRTPEDTEDSEVENFDEEEADLAAPAQAGLLRNSAVMASGSIVSRVTGVLRNTALSAAVGYTITADAFALGNSLPSIVYVLVIGGALNAIFVPQLVRRMADDSDGGKRYTDSLLSSSGVLLVVVTIVSVLAAPLIVDIYATDSYTQGQVSLAIAFARYCLPQILFFGLYTMLSQVLNARGHFGMPMYAPVFNNLVAIATYVSFVVVVGTEASADGALSAGETAWLGVGTTLGIAAQALILIPVMMRSGYRWSFTRQWRGMGLGKAGRLAGWTIGLVAVTQAAFVVITRLATQANVNAEDAGTAAAGLATYTNGYLVFMIPHGIVTVSLVTAQLPNLSRLVHSGRNREAGADIGHTMRLAATIITPLALGLLMGAQPLSALLFNYGAATPEQAAVLGTVLALFMLGLLPFTLYYVIQRGWYAREDTRTPFLFAVLMNAIFVAVAVVLFPRAAPGGPQVGALALAYSVANWVTLLVAWPVLARNYEFLDVRRTLSALARLIVAAAGAAGAVIASRYVLAPYQMGGSKMLALFDLALTSVIVGVTFVAIALLLRVREVRELLTWVTGALRRRR